MSNNLLFSILVVFSLLIFSSCESESIPASEVVSELNFMPIDSISTWEYRMDSIIYDNEGLDVDTFVSYRQERLAGEFMDAEGKISHRLVISKKVDWNDEYKETDLWTIQLNDQGYQRREENLNFVKLQFPIVLGDTWNGNQFPDTTLVYVAGEDIDQYSNWVYSYEERLDSLSVRGELYNDVLKVFQADNTNAIDRRFSVEYYSKGVGMIQRNMEILHFQPNPNNPDGSNLPWADKAHKGFILKQELINFF